MVTKKEDNGVFGQGKIEPWTHEEMIRYGKIAGIAVVIAVILFAGWMYYTSPALMPNKQADQGGGGAKSTPVPAGKEAVVAAVAAGAITDSAAADTETGKIEVPADAWILKVGEPSVDNLDNPRIIERNFPIGKTPKTIWIQERHTFYIIKEFTARKISGIAAIESTTETAGTQSSINLYFYKKDGELIKGLRVYAESGSPFMPGYSGKEFTMEFPEEVWGADSVAIIAPI